MMFGALGVALSVQVIGCHDVGTKRMYKRTLFVDNDNYERWIHCLPELAGQRNNADTHHWLVEDSP